MQEQQHSLPIAIKVYVSLDKDFISESFSLCIVYFGLSATRLICQVQRAKVTEIQHRKSVFLARHQVLSRSVKQLTRKT